MLLGILMMLQVLVSLFGIVSVFKTEKSVILGLKIEK